MGNAFGVPTPPVARITGQPFIDDRFEKILANQTAARIRADSLESRLNFIATEIYERDRNQTVNLDEFFSHLHKVLYDNESAAIASSQSVHRLLDALRLQLAEVEERVTRRQANELAVLRTAIAEARQNAWRDLWQDFRQSARVLWVETWIALTRPRWRLRG
jgi:protein-disulfide isomerase-like protein with CxxC motif